MSTFVNFSNLLTKSGTPNGELQIGKVYQYSWPPTVQSDGAADDTASILTTFQHPFYHLVQEPELLLLCHVRKDPHLPHKLSPRLHCCVLARTTAMAQQVLLL